MSKLRVLLVEDEDDIREVAALSLSLDDGLEVRPCNGGPAAIETVRAWNPDIVLLDVMMPGMDGPTTLRNLRQQPGLDETPVIFVTARTQGDEIEHFLSLGAVDVIAKPFDPMTLAAQVRGHAERHAA